MSKSVRLLAVLLFALAMSFMALGQGLTTFSYSVNNSTVSPATTGSGTIVGTSPDDTTTTTITTVVVPIILNITQTNIQSTPIAFDPTSTHTGCLDASSDPITLLKQSPVFQPVSISINGVNEGTVQWPDAIQRAEFRNDPNHPTNASHHTKLSNPPTIGSTLTISIDAGTSGNSRAQVFPNESGCGGTVAQAVVDINADLGLGDGSTIRSKVENYIATNINDASKLPVFVTYNTSMVINDAPVMMITRVAPSDCTHPTDANCDVQGFHGALGASANAPTTSAPGQTYVMANFQGNGSEFTGVKDISAIAAEIAAWANNPSTKNTQSPAWGSIGEQSGCVTNHFEVGEPLKGTLAPTITRNSFAYNFQEVAFLSWFYRDSTSRGDGGKYSSNGTFTGYAQGCSSSGGTN